MKKKKFFDEMSINTLIIGKTSAGQMYRPVYSFLQYVRLQNNESHENMANKLGMTSKELYLIEMGIVLPPVDFIKKVLKLYKVTFLDVKGDLKESDFAGLNETREKEE